MEKLFKVEPGDLAGVYLLDGELRETQTANYFSDVYPIDCTVSPANALFCRKNGTLLQAGNLL